MPIDVSVVIGPRSGKGGSGDPGTGTPSGKIPPQQIVGFVPMYVCDEVECRDTNPPCCFRLKFFGVDNQRAESYENDVNSFLVSNSLSVPNPSATITFYLQKCELEYWSTVATLNNNDYGTYSAIGTIPNLPTYAEYKVSWGLVLNLQGIGVYRIKAVTSFGAIADQCLVSEVIELIEWDCNRAHGTVKFEANISGTVGDINNDGNVFDLCTKNHYDSIRFPGFFGFETTSEYLEILHEYQTGQINRIRDEAVQKFKLKTHPLPKWLHDRFKVYGLMADTLRVSDYNRNNSDYSISRKQVVKDGNYEPEYYDKQTAHTKIRMSKVTVDFKEGIQSVIKSSCCDSEHAG